MANLRVHKKNGNYNEELRKQLKNDLHGVEETIRELEEKKVQLKRELLELDIEPFKIGGYAICEVPAGRKTKVQKCLLECVNGILYVRPVAEDNTPSNRHFSMTPTGKYTYHDLLKKVEG